LPWQLSAAYVRPDAAGTGRRRRARANRRSNQGASDAGPDLCAEAACQALREDTGMTAAGVVVIGTGQAGFQAAVSLREAGFADPIRLLGEEPELPYQRPPLSKAYLTGKLAIELVRLRPAAFYAGHGIELRLGQRAAAIDRAGRQVVLTTGERLAYDHLILATGARNRALPVPGAGLDGVVQLRALAEADALRQRLGTARRAVVVGAGFIGLEFAAVAAEAGLDVTVVEAAPRVMARAVSEPVSAFFQRAHEARGVRFLMRSAAVEILGADGCVSAVATACGERVAADLVLVGIGVVPDTALAAEAGLSVANGIAVDAQLLTRDLRDLGHRRLCGLPLRPCGGGRRRPAGIRAERRGPGPLRGVAPCGAAGALCRPALVLERAGPAQAADRRPRHAARPRGVPRRSRIWRLLGLLLPRRGAGRRRIGEPPARPHPRAQAAGELGRASRRSRPRTRIST
jgi:thioredoxin reductase